MPSIDERVVEMKFDRDDFLAGTEQTLEALNKLDTALSGGGAIAKGLSTIEQGFSGIGAIATGSLMKLGSMAVAAGAKLASNVMDPIFGGGKKRALNLEHANFQLTGIMTNAVGAKKAGKEVESIMEDVEYAVKGTAYGLDAAAVAAAQFAASGLRGGDKMKDALRGISGVAAMAGSSYEDVANVFTKVAGQGRLMGDDLNRLAARGINAASTLAKSMGVSEDAVRQMVSKGKISFDEFSSAMNEAFGDHATKANETYAGSLGNIKAALARIGAGFFLVEHEKMRRIFNALRPAINAFNAQLLTMWPLYKKLYAIPMAKWFERQGAAIENWTGWDNFGKSLRLVLRIGGNLKKAISSWVSPIKAAFEPLFGYFRSLSTPLEGVVKGLKAVNEWVKGLKASAEQQQGVFDFLHKPILDIITKLRWVDEEVANGGSRIQKTFEAFAPALAPLIGVFESMRPALQAFWDLFMLGVDWVVEKFNVLAPYVTEFLDGLFGQEGKVTQFFGGLRDEIVSTGDVFGTIGGRIKGFFNEYLKPVSDFAEGVKAAFKGLLSGSGLDMFGDAITDAVSKLGPFWSSISSKGGIFVDWLKDIFNPLEALKSLLPDFGGELTQVGADMNVDLEAVGKGLSEVFKNIGNGLKAMASGFSDFMANAKIEDFEKVAGILTKLGFVFIAYKNMKNFDAMAKGIVDGIKGISDALGGFAAAAKKTATGNMILNIAIAIGIIAAALWVLAQIPPGQLWQAVGVMVAIAAVLVLITLALSKINPASVASTAFGLMLLAFALGGLAATLLILGMIPFPVLQQGLTAVLILLAALVVAAMLLGTVSNNLIVAGIGLAMIAGALTLLVVPISILGMMDQATLSQGLTAVALALLLLTAAGVAIGQVGADALMGALGIAAIAGAITLLVIPIQQLGAMDQATLSQGLVAVAIALLLLTAAAVGAQGAMAGGIALIIVAAAVLVFVFAMQQVAALGGAAGGALVVIALGMLILVAASAAMMAVLPGALGLAGLLVAFGAAAIMFGAGVLLASMGVAMFAGTIPALTAGLIGMASVAGTLLILVPVLALLGVALIAFGVGALVAGVGVAVLGVAMLALGVGMMLVATYAATAAPALMAFIAAIAPLWTEGLALAAVAVALAVLGAAMIVLGVGMALVGVGGLLMGVGLTVAAIGLAAFMIVATVASTLAETVATGFAKLQAAVGPLAAFGGSLTTAAVGLQAYSASALLASNSGQTLATQLTILAVVMAALGAATTTSASVVSSGLSDMVNAVTVGGDAITAGAGLIVLAFATMNDSIAKVTIAATVQKMMAETSSALVAGAAVIAASCAVVTLAFDGLGKGIDAQKGPILVAVAGIITGISLTLTVGAALVGIGVVLISTAVGRLPSAISAHSGAVYSAASGLVQRAISGLRSGGPGLAAWFVGISISMGMARGILAGGTIVSSAARVVAQRAISAAKAALDSHSPSREFFKIGEDTSEGMALGIRAKGKDVETATTKVAKGSLNAMQKALSSVGEDPFAGMRLNPTITPVLDLTTAQRQAAGLTDMAGGVFGSRTNVAQAASLLELERPGVSSDSPTQPPVKEVNYVQNNYSPKALSEGEVYRQTKNLISSFDKISG